MPSCQRTPITNPISVTINLHAPLPHQLTPAPTLQLRRQPHQYQFKHAVDPVPIQFRVPEHVQHLFRLAQPLFGILAGEEDAQDVVL